MFEHHNVIQCLCFPHVLVLIIIQTLAMTTLNLQMIRIVKKVRNCFSNVVMLLKCIFFVCFIEPSLHQNDYYLWISKESYDAAQPVTLVAEPRTAAATATTITGNVAILIRLQEATYPVYWSKLIPSLPNILSCHQGNKHVHPEPFVIMRNTLTVMM